MGREGPMIALALGRSPYDEVVAGEGDDDPQVSSQQYDSHGRPTNAETKRINRDIIRSHNEVMLVIGVAEPESIVDSEKAGPSHSEREHLAHESFLGSRVLSVGRTLWIAGTWGISGLAHRLFLYERYSAVPLLDLFRYERRERSLSVFLFSGIQTLGLSHGLRWAAKSTFSSQWEKYWFKSVWTYVRLHLLQFMLLKKLDLIPTNVWLPSLGFFIPFTDASLIPPLPPLPSGAVLGRGSMKRWCGAALMGLAPFAVFWLSDLLWGVSVCMLVDKINSYLPSPSHGTREKAQGLGDKKAERTDRTVAPAGEATAVAVATTEPASAVSSPPQPPESPDNRTTNPATPATWSPSTVTASGRTGSFQQPGPRQPSTNSGRGDDYGTDDEEVNGPNAPVISFDVELMEETNADPPPGFWSAELRPSPGMEARRRVDAAPVYKNTMLARLPAFFATEILASSLSWLLVAPVEILAIRLVSRGFALRHGLGVAGMYGAARMWGLPSWRSVANFAGVEFVRLMIGVEVWSVVAAASQFLHMSEGDWEGRQKRQEAGAVQEARQEAVRAVEEVIRAQAIAGAGTASEAAPAPDTLGGAPTGEEAVDRAEATLAVVGLAEAGDGAAADPPRQAM